MGSGQRTAGSKPTATKTANGPERQVRFALCLVALLAAGAVVTTIMVCLAQPPYALKTDIDATHLRLTSNQHP
jgi:hypothetical protein